MLGAYILFLLIEGTPILLAMVAVGLLFLAVQHFASKRHEKEYREFLYDYLGEHDLD
ncbi:hypothetical protein [Atopobium deltae]|uniref:Uncharacterized protein n=1 Tax=Atopobium deltae TaxID=1393034 RepID=A0A133XWL1_9ACTN|nr:hypothetical protein [Atopobium deltae]KXB35322.1 hypothetical protein HMPREF3192_00406 [Atopobium deltae]